MAEPNHPGPVEELHWPGRGQRAPVLLVGLSVRMLVDSALRGGWDPVAIDCFGDRDTRCSASRLLALPGCDSFSSDTVLLSAVESLTAPFRTIPLVYGSGIDHRPGFLENLPDSVSVSGNCVQTLRLINSPKAFFSLLKDLQIPYPESTFRPPADKSGWLFKKSRGQGGVGVRRAAFLKTDECLHGFYQRYVRGPVCSVLFLADGRRAAIVGFNSQWAQAVGDLEFLFCGISNDSGLGEKIKKQVVVYVDKLVKSAPLKGLNSLDFIIDDGICKILEVNPRPCASMALYDQDYPEGLFAAHVEAVSGRLVQPAGTRRDLRATEILYTAAGLRIDPCITWPTWTNDRPVADTEIAAGMPVCSISASGNSRRQVRHLLDHRKAQLLKKFHDFSVNT